MRCISLCLVVAVLAAPASAAERRAVVATRAASPVVVDGDLSKPAWQAANWYSDFTILGAPDTPAPLQTRFKVMFDDRNLYVGAEMDESDVAHVKAEARERDGQVYADDCLELMIDPTGRRVEYYHFIVNPIGTLYDAWLRQAGHVRSSDWDCNWVAKARVGAKSWTVEAAIPLVELGLTGESGGDWAINVTRERRAGPQQLSTFAPMTASFHQPELYATLKLPGANLGQYQWDIKQPFDTHVYRKNGAIVFQGKTFVRNETGKFAFFSLRTSFLRKGAASLPATLGSGLDAGQGREIAFVTPVADSGQQSLRLEIADRKDPAVVYAIRTLPMSVEYSPITTTFLQPSYRDSIYATQTLDKLKLQLDFALSPEEAAGASVKVSLRPVGQAAGKPLAEVSLAPLSPTMTVEMPATTLAVGDYEVETQVISAGKALYRSSKPLHKLPPVADEWRIDENLVLRHNGAPVLPFGFFSIPAAEMAKPDAPWVLAQTYSASYFPLAEMKTMLDGFAAAGTALAFEPWFPHKTVEESRYREPLSDDEIASIRRRVHDLKDHPAVLCWYMWDEPEGSLVLPERLKACREVCALEDPYHPCIMLNDSIDGILKYRDGGDILMPDPYPCFVKGGLAASPIEKVGKFMDACYEAGGGRKAVWVTPQAFNYGDCGQVNGRCPTFTELRNMTYQSVAHGARGFLFYTWGSFYNYPALSIGMPFLAREARDLKSAILAPLRAESPQISAAEPKLVDAAYRVTSVGRYLFVVNNATAPQHVKVTLPQLGDGPYAVVSEGRTVSARGGVIEDDFAVYGAHIYSTDLATATRETVAATQAKIEAADAARRKPGNLAFEDNGTHVEMSSHSLYGNAEARVLDGIETGMQWESDPAQVLPQWLAVVWPKPVTLGRVVLYSATVADCEIQVPDGGNWKTLAGSQGNTGDRIEISFAPVQAQKLRVLVTKSREGKGAVQLWEVEAYER